MSYDLYSGEAMDYIGPVASSGGWSAVLEAVKDAGAEADDLLDSGVSANPRKAAEQLQEWLDKEAGEKVVRSTVENLCKLLGQAKDLAVISDGVGIVSSKDDADEEEKS